MKRFMVLLLAVLMCFMLVACGSKYSEGDIAGTWVYNPSKSDSASLDVLAATLILAENGTCAKETIDHNGEVTIYGGKWVMEKGKSIEVVWDELLAGEDPFYANGKPKYDPYEQTFKIEDENTLTSGVMYWVKK